MNKVLVIGDIIIDKYIYGTSTRISPEAPVPVVTHLTEKETLGGAGLVYENLKSLGVNVTLLDIDQQNSVKTRVICDGHYITRIDDDKQADGDAVLERIKQSDFSVYDYVILSDYNKGVLNNAKKIIKHINKFNCKIIVDPKTNMERYEGAWLIKPNEKEFQEYFTNWQGNIITTRAGKSVVAKIDDKEFEVPVETIEVSDVTGAGDCFLAAFVYGLTKGYDYDKALKVAVRGSTESVKHAGTYILNKSDLEETIVFTNGVFDILHTGHLKLLEYARSRGDRLVVGINSDDSVKRLKGPNRPINNHMLRKEQLLALPWVDEVQIFKEDTPLELMNWINPDLIIKGGDYIIETVVGHEKYNVEIFPTVEGKSTTNIIERMNENFSNRS
jgi:D-beta-D-heptose 7-phosphate kinase/D-beta-D-heptose 1-phosphate adenosyltransferase